MPSYKDKLDDYNTFTVSGWFYQTETLSGVCRLLCSRASTTSTAKKFKVKKGAIEVTDGEKTTTVLGLLLGCNNGTMLIVR